MTYWYTTPSPAFRQVFALRSSEGNATCGRIEAYEARVNGTAVLGKTLIFPILSGVLGPQVEVVNRFRYNLPRHYTCGLMTFLFHTDLRLERQFSAEKDSRVPVENALKIDIIRLKRRHLRAA